ncbi:DUF202 domain-containing protein [Streptomyces odontomachi]|uniref:DUF202 domain-containing protein n=1 Tax=Streptomyces odontomachi TaxID=2944940 RepID=UPI0027E371A7|nr:DUF202 domain-containing protein [Streptomyces sp. ODS25]
MTPAVRAARGRPGPGSGERHDGGGGGDDGQGHDGQGGSGGGGERGLQPERTRLAWRRTTLTATGVTVLGVKAALRADSTLGALLTCALCLLLWLAFVAATHLRVRALATSVPRQLAPRVAATAVLCTVALALCAAAVIIA